MDSFTDDPRFSHITTDPRFRPMPKAKRKVKIDKRFDALFSSKHFKTRTDIDKRGRPVLDVSKRNKHVMERFYELSSGESESDDNTCSDEDEEGVVETAEMNTDGDGSTVDDSPQIAGTEKIKSVKKPLKSSLKKRKLSDSKNGSETFSKKARLSTSAIMGKIESNGEPVDHDSCSSVEDDDADEDDEANEDGDPNENDSAESDANGSEDSDKEDEDSDGEESLPEYTGDFDIEETGVEHKWNELHNDAIEVSESTHRLAVCNMDWDFVKAQDLFVLLKSFVPEGGRVKSVIIYPSQYGKERMEEEALLGPKEMRDLVKENEEDSSSNQQRNNKKKRRKKRNAPTDQKEEKRQEKEIVKHETEKLREYQLNRLRYYFAVVDCDSKETADAIYNECDGKEYQLSSVRLDLRFIPNDMTFDDDPKDSFSEDQGLIDYAPNRFNSTALSQAKVEVTWDETDFDRLSKRIVGLQQKELESIVEDNQYADLIAPPESDSEAENDNPDWLSKALAEDSEEEHDDDEGLTEEKKIQLYRKVLMDKLTEEKDAEDGDIDQEIQWTPGLKSSAQEKLKKKKKDKEVKSDIVGGYLEKKKQKKKNKLEKKKKEMASAAEGDEDLAFSDDDFPDDMDEDLKRLVESEGVGVSGKSKSKGKKKKAKKEEQADDSETERERAELELLMMGDGEKSIAKPKAVEEGGKMSKKKKKKMAKLAKEKKQKEKQDFALDMNDDRFSALFTSHHFHIDPNAPQFKKTQNMMQLVNEQITRKKKPKVKTSTKTLDSEVVPDSKLVSKQLVESLKKKMKKRV